MRLRNWEHNASSGLPISGATVEARAASLVSPNTGTIIASTTTDANGMWEFVSLPDAATDIKVISGANIWWHKGLTRHNIDELFYNTPTPRTDQFLKNGGFDTATANGAGPWTVTTDVPVLDGWRSVSGAGSSAVVSRETTIKAPDSAASAKVVHTRVSGNFVLYQQMANPAQFRGKTITLSVQVRQGVANSAVLALSDSAGQATSTTSATTGSFVTLTVTRTIDAAATFVQASLQITASDTVYFDDAILNLGAQASTFQPEYWYAGAVGADQLADAGVTDVKMANQKVNRTGDTMSGALTINNNLSVNGTGGVAVTEIGVTNTSTGVIDLHTVGVNDTDFNVRLQAANGTNGTSGTGTLYVSAASIQRNGLTVWDSGTDGAGSGLDADLLDGLDSAAFMQKTGGVFSGVVQFLLNSAGVALQIQNTNAGGFSFGLLNTAGSAWDMLASHSSITFGVPLLVGSSTVWHSGNDGAGSGLDADLLDGLNTGNAAGNVPINNTGLNINLNADFLDNQHGTFFQARANHTGTQAPSTISPQGAGSALDADTVDGIHGSGFIQTSPTGAQTITISGGGGTTINIGSAVAGGTINGMAIAGDFKATGIKARAATGRDGQVGTFHAIETPLPKFEEHGRAQLVDGAVTVAIPADLANYLALDEYHVFVTAESPAALYVAERTPTAFVVRALMGDAQAHLSWHLVARQGDMIHIERDLPVVEPI